jgi:hypothetical protein
VFWVKIIDELGSSKENLKLNIELAVCGGN